MSTRGRTSRSELKEVTIAIEQIEQKQKFSDHHQHTQEGAARCSGGSGQGRGGGWSRRRAGGERVGGDHGGPGRRGGHDQGLPAGGAVSAPGGHRIIATD